MSDGKTLEMNTKTEGLLNIKQINSQHSKSPSKTGYWEVNQAQLTENCPDNKVSPKAISRI